MSTMPKAMSWYLHVLPDPGSRKEPGNSLEFFIALSIRWNISLSIAASRVLWWWGMFAVGKLGGLGFRNMNPARLHTRPKILRSLASAIVTSIPRNMVNTPAGKPTTNHWCSVRAKSVRLHFRQYWDIGKLTCSSTLINITPLVDEIYSFAHLIWKLNL